MRSRWKASWCPGPATPSGLLLDYASNVARYPAFQANFREHRPPLLAVWGKNDPFFLPAGAQAWKRDIPGAQVRFYDTGHLALETHGVEIGGVIRGGWMGMRSRGKAKNQKLPMVATRLAQ